MNARGVPWLSAEAAAQHLGCPSAKAFRKFLDRLPANKQPKRYYLGRRLRFRQVDLDALIEPAPAVEQSAPLRIVGRR